MSTDAGFPFSAMVELDDVKRSLLLAAVDPSIGGVLIEGPRGTGKSTIARGLAELLPEGRLVTLPLGTTEERLIGTLDLEKVLNAGQVRFSPGLLQAAHRGVLYVDEVNLLPDHLVDVLLDVAASGVNRVERDGISHSHPASFVLIGTMNPDEGELRPQLLDRFGFCVTLARHLNADARNEIVSRRLAYDDDPEGFIRRHSAQQEALADRCVGARALLADVPLDAGSRAEVARRCSEAGVDGVRADLVMLRAARAHAALEGRREIGRDDIDAVAELALRHRRPQSEPRPPESSRRPAETRAVPPLAGGAGVEGEQETRPVPIGAARDPSYLLKKN